LRRIVTRFDVGARAARSQLDDMEGQRGAVGEAAVSAAASILNTALARNLRAITARRDGEFADRE
jgi:hypothetical protein